LENRIKNVKGQSTSSEEAPEYFGAKRRLSLKNENIMCDRSYNNKVLLHQSLIVKLVVSEEKSLVKPFPCLIGQDYFGSFILYWSLPSSSLSFEHQQQKRNRLLRPRLICKLSDYLLLLHMWPFEHIKFSC
jgi:hypothetical protein